MAVADPPDTLTLTTLGPTFAATAWAGLTRSELAGPVAVVPPGGMLRVVWPLAEVPDGVLVPPLVEVVPALHPSATTPSDITSRTTSSIAEIRRRPLHRR